MRPHERELSPLVATQTTTPDGSLGLPFFFLSHFPQSSDLFALSHTKIDHIYDLTASPEGDSSRSTPLPSSLAVSPPTPRHKRPRSSSSLHSSGPLVKRTRSPKRDTYSQLTSATTFVSRETSASSFSQQPKRRVRKARAPRKSQNKQVPAEIPRVSPTEAEETQSAPGVPLKREPSESGKIFMSALQELARDYWGEKFHPHRKVAGTPKNT